MMYVWINVVQASSDTEGLVHCLVSKVYDYRLAPSLVSSSHRCFMSPKNHLFTSTSNAQIPHSKTPNGSFGRVIFWP